LTERRGEELLMWFLAGFPARTSALPERAQDSTASDPACGEKWRGSWAKYDPDSCSWRTRQHSLLGGLDEFSETWPRSGLMRRGECYPLLTWAHRTSESESGSWPTPRSCSAMAATITPESAWEGSRFPNLETVVGRRTWPTPTTNDSHNWTMPPSQVNHDNLPGELLRRGEGRPGGKLNPMWVEWLMGWPLGWTDCAPSGTDRFQSWLRQHSESFPSTLDNQEAA
jgi:hypothetical protein